MLLKIFVRYTLPLCYANQIKQSKGTLHWAEEPRNPVLNCLFQQHMHHKDALKPTNQVSSLAVTALPGTVPFPLTRMYASKVTDVFRHESGVAHPWCVLDSCQRLVAGALVRPVCVPCVDCPQQRAQPKRRCRKPLSHPGQRTMTRSCGQGPASNHGHHHVRQTLWLRLCCTPLMPQVGR